MVDCGIETHWWLHKHLWRFKTEFDQKYFPSKTWDRLEAKFMNFTQVKRSIRQYEEQFNRFHHFVGKKMEAEVIQILLFL